MSIWAQAREMASQTPPTRDRYVDFLRALSILVVVTGHWLVAAFVYRDGTIIDVNVLVVAPGTQWLTWVFQVMPIFFIVGGFSNAVSRESAKRRSITYAGWLSARLQRLLAPLLPLVGFWGLGALVLTLAGVDGAAIQKLTQIALIPIWFLAIYVMVVVLAPATYKAWERYGVSSFFALAGVAVLVDSAVLIGNFKWAGWTNYFWIWLAVHQLGYAWRDGLFEGAKRYLAMSALGWLLLAALIFFGPYPLAMVSSPDPDISNTLPPKITLLALGIAQLGLLLALRHSTKRLLDNLHVWTATVLVNSMIMTVYLWHITVMVAVLVIAWLLGGPGLSVEPASGHWWATRPIWLLLLYAVLVPVVLLLAPIERGKSGSENPPSAGRQVTGAVMACLGIALIARFGFGNAPIAYLDFGSFILVFLGTAVAGLGFRSARV